MKTKYRIHFNRGLHVPFSLTVGLALLPFAAQAQLQDGEPKPPIRSSTVESEIQARVGPSPGIAPADDYNSALSQAVKTRLIHDKTIPSHRLKVESEDGIVTISGTVETLLAKERALTHAQLVSGVREIHDEITIETPEREDDKVRSEVMMAIAKNPATDAVDIQAEVREGIVALTGTVESWAERQLAEQTAKGIKGVRSVENGLSIDVPTNRSDREIADDIRQRLEADIVLQQSTIAVEVKNGKATLAGRVPNLYQKERAFADAWIEGVQSVDVSRLRLDPGLIAVRGPRPETTASDPQPATAKPQSDAELEQQIVESFAADPFVSKATPKVEVQNGTVTLTGRVNTYRTSRTAEQLARQIPGVRKVENLISVRPQVQRNDQTLTESIRTSIHRDPYLEPFDIQVQSSKGVVTLRGEVDSTFERLEAEAVAAESPGVVKVRNLLTVKRDRVGYETWPFVAHENPTEEIPAALAPGDPRGPTQTAHDKAMLEEVLLQLSTHPTLKGNAIRATVANGIVTLSGTVATAVERQEAVEEAFEAGAREVVNRIQVGGSRK